MVNPKYRLVDVVMVARFSDIFTFLRTQRVEPNAEIKIGLDFRGGPREAPVHSITNGA